MLGYIPLYIAFALFNYSCSNENNCELILKPTQEMRVYGTWVQPNDAGTFFIVNNSDYDIYQVIVKEISSYSSSHDGNDVRIDTLFISPKENYALAAEKLYNSQGFIDSIVKISIISEKKVEYIPSEF